MAGLSLKEVGDKLRFECVLCGAEVTVQRMAEHAEMHARRGECWSYGSFDGASKLDGRLEGWPVVSAWGEEQLWPFWERTERLAPAHHEHAVAV